VVTGEGGGDRRMRGQRRRRRKRRKGGEQRADVEEGRGEQKGCDGGYTHMQHVVIHFR
jgi:hypothetical protein